MEAQVMEGRLVADSRTKPVAAAGQERTAWPFEEDILSVGMIDNPSCARKMSREPLLVSVMPSKAIVLERKNPVRTTFPCALTATPEPKSLSVPPAPRTHNIFPAESYLLQKTFWNPALIKLLLPKLALPE